MNLVTGANGHLGANLVRRLLEDGEPVRVLLREGTETRAVDGLAIERVSGDIRNYPKTLAAVRGCQRVFELSLVRRGHTPDYSTFVPGPRAPCLVRYRRRVGAGTAQMPAKAALGARLA